MRKLEHIGIIERPEEISSGPFLFAECAHDGIPQFFQIVLCNHQLQLERRRRKLLLQGRHTLHQQFNLLLLLEEYTVIVLLDFIQRGIDTICKFIDMLIMVGIVTDGGTQILCSAQVGQFHGYHMLFILERRTFMLYTVL